MFYLKELNKMNLITDSYTTYNPCKKCNVFKISLNLISPDAEGLCYKENAFLSFFQCSNIFKVSLYFIKYIFCNKLPNKRNKRFGMQYMW